MALGIAASTAGGLVKNFGTMTKPLHCGMAAQSGVMAAMLAAEGFTASEDVFSGEDGYFSVLSGPPVTTKPPSFGDPFAVLSPGLYVKRYPCCFATHRAIDAILSIRSENPWLQPDGVQSITCLAPGKSYIALIHDDPRTALEAKFCMQYAVAAAFVDGFVQVDSFTDEKVHRTEVRALMSRVRKVEDPALPLTDANGTDCRFTEVAVTTVDGRRLVKRVVRPKGSVDNPLSAEELSDKFISCSRGVVSAGRQRAALTALQSLEALPDISLLMASLVSSAEANMSSPTYVAE